MKCITWNFNKSNMVWKVDDLKKLRFKDGDIIPNVESYFVSNLLLLYYYYFGFIVIFFCNKTLEEYEIESL
jgi:hypothetical protein